MREDGAAPPQTPAYPDDELRQLGEELARLYQVRDGDPDQADAARSDIVRVRQRMRRGPRLQPGEFLADGRYRLMDRLPRRAVDGHWKAWDRQQSQFVHVRVFHGDWVADPAEIQAFLRRGAQLTRLQHPRIGRVFDAGRTDDGFVYVATRLLEGDSLDEVTSLDPIDGVQVMLEVAQAVSAAHAAGVVHGDIRPGNVILSSDGSAFLTGFSVTPDDAGDMAGLFRAPETAARGAAPTTAGDVYALGMTAMQVLNSGELPFWVLRDPARLIQSLDVPESVRRVLVKAIEWDLQERYPDVASLLSDLHNNPDLMGALSERARARGRHAEAIAYDESLLPLQPEREVDLRCRLAEGYMSLGSFEPAFGHLVRALEAAPDVAGLFGPLRAIAERTDGWARLAEALRQVAPTRDEANRAAMHTELARICQYEVDDAAAASEAWERVLEDHRTPEQGVSALRALAELGMGRDWASFARHSEHLLSFLPEEERPAVEYAIGRAYIEHLGREELGLEYIDRAESHGWSEVDLSTRLQQVRAQMGQWQRVVQLMMLQAQAQDIAQASPTLMRAGIIANAVHLEEEAFAVYHALLERAPRHVVALRHLARMHLRAHEHEHALQYYERLWDSYHGKECEEPEASERAADCTAYAKLLMRQDRPDSAAERLEEAMRLASDHVPTLQLAGPLFLDLGEVERAAEVFERLLTLFKSVERSAQKIEACLGMGDLAWLQGRLTAAMGWFNRAIELDPFNSSGWWGLAKVSLAARGGHPGADRAPWIRATPKRYTPEEGLARLLAGVLSPRSLRVWLNRSPMGTALVEGGASPMRLACGAVDVMIRNEVVGPDLFARIAAACPDWAGPIDEVRKLFQGGPVASFPMAQSYAWSSRLVEADFDATEPRAMLAKTGAVTSDYPVTELSSSSSWELLLADAQPPPPAPYVPPEELEARKRALLPGPVVALSQGSMLWGSLGRAQRELAIGTDDDCDVRIPEDRAVQPVHAILSRLGEQVYASPVDNAQLLVNDQPRTRWRMRPGDRITVGSTVLEVALHIDASTLPTEVRTAPDVARPEEVAELEALIEAQRTPEHATARQVQAPPRPAPPTPEPALVTTPGAPPVESEDGEVVRTASPTLAPMPRVEEWDPQPAAPVSEEAPTEVPPHRVEAPVQPTEAPGEVPPVRAEPEPEPEPYTNGVGSEAQDAPLNPFFSAFPDSDEGGLPAALGHAFDEAPTEEPPDNYDPVEPRAVVAAAFEPPTEPMERSAAAVPDVVPDDDDVVPDGFSDDAPDEAPGEPVATAGVDGPLHVGDAWLEYMSGPDRGQAVPVGSQLSVGQSDVCGMSIPTDSRMSPTHCLVQRTETGFLLRDAGSTTGTVVNGERIGETELRGGETIMVGRTVLRFRMET